MTNIERSLDRFHRRLADDEHHRYRSWGHCYRWFRQRKRIRSEEDIELSALQLGFYLASWGMILLGAFGCTPAYDSYFVKGLRRGGIAFSGFNERHFRKLCEFYRKHAAEFQRIQRRIHENGIRYPVMKLIDMYFWEVGRGISG